MKKLMTVVFALLLAGSLSFAQAGGGSTDKEGKGTKTAETTSGKKATKTSKAHKGGKKSKKGSSTTSTPPK
ncbi:MAG TPA: hypothetical protein VKW06_16070 [Candidatus Angelobacter sp.]|nr:hypothetical protein [Candidatus Angelobacter sp.]